MAATSLWRSKSFSGSEVPATAKAITAMAHNLARLVYRMLKYGEEHVDKGKDFYKERYEQQQFRWFTKQASELGLSLVPATTDGQSA
jgi:transposase